VSVVAAKFANGWVSVSKRRMRYETASDKLTKSSRTRGKQWGAAGNTGCRHTPLTSEFACFPRSADESQCAHNPKVVGSNPTPATTRGARRLNGFRAFAVCRGEPPPVEISHQLTDPSREARNSGARSATFGLAARRVTSSRPLFMDGREQFAHCWSKRSPVREALALAAS
jgi:hypothetical protein